MIHAKIALSEDVVITVCDGVISLELEQIEIYADPVEIGSRKFELAGAAIALAIEELTPVEDDC